MVLCLKRREAWSTIIWKACHERQAVVSNLRRRTMATNDPRLLLAPSHHKK
jgi:hypothetical protein